MDHDVNSSWQSLSLAQQMINIGNEVKRAFRFDEGSERRKMFAERALKYTDLTIEDPKNAHVLPEIMLSREVLLDCFGNRQLAISAAQVNRYYETFTLL